MQSLKYLIVTLLLAFSLNLQAETRITEQAVNEMSAQMLNAIIDKDADGLLNNFSTNAQIIMDMPEEMGGKVTLTVPEYRRLLLEAWATPIKFSYQVSNTRIDIADDGQSAVATDTVVETVTLDGRIIATTISDEKLDIIPHPHSGKLLITRAYAKSRNRDHPSPTP